MKKPPYSRWKVRGDSQLHAAYIFTDKEVVTVDTYVELTLGDYIVYHEISMTPSRAINQLLNYYKKP